jgi:hypothetical protein
MTTLAPKPSTDLNGWTQITCWQAEIVRRRDLTVASSRTRLELNAPPDVFTEWWAARDPRLVRDVPVLREYLDHTGCRHYLANRPEEAALEETDDSD